MSRYGLLGTDCGMDIRDQLEFHIQKCMNLIEGQAGPDGRVSTDIVEAVLLGKRLVVDTVIDEVKIVDKDGKPLKERLENKPNPYYDSRLSTTEEYAETKEQKNKRLKGNPWNDDDIAGDAR